MFLALPYYSHSSAKSIHSFFLYTTQGDAEQAELQESIYTNDTQGCYITGIIIAAQNNKDCVCFLYKQEPENIKSQLPVFITDEHGLKEIKVLLYTNTMGSSSHNKTLSRNAVTKGFSHPTSHPVQGWMGNNKAFCSHGTRDGHRVIKVYSIKW